ncbi:MAG: elongation factor P maturation arginine rhamnosyltransferase EarP [Burkholderiaceae bacterium]|nr:elongation factor P maturation arginine rhamnosyltransferase EarP [Burkholderiaceae bacterium]MEB2317989.1 elongation factor P maturation arginine rhamnosyltransferase EarP [Pseudomonadota bacterium]
MASFASSFGASRPAIDIVCRVVDYYGDAGIGWRLAAGLALEHGFDTCLWIDRPDMIAAMAPAGAPHVEVRHLDDFEADYRARDVLLTTFDSRIGDAVRGRIRAAGDRTLRVHFEYLSAEPWIDGCHGLPSLKADGSTEWMFMPGFTAASGGLIRERNLAAMRAGFDRPGQDAFLDRLGAGIEPGRRVSLFCYPEAPADDWFATLASAPEPTLLFAAHGVAIDSVVRFFGTDPAPGRLLRQGSLALLRLPFMPQVDYDRLLLACDLNFVRGEDSWIRAHWARRPFVWQPYIQTDGAHLDKLDAFLALALAGAPAGTADSLRRFAHAWSGDGSVASAWPDFLAALPAIGRQLAAHVDRLESQSDCCTRLAILIRDRL